MSKISTAEEFLKSDNEFDDVDMILLAESLKTKNVMDISDISMTMIEFAKLHVEVALTAALENSPTGSSTDILSYEDMKDAILNAYPLENIK
jgi:hypothetical protein